VSESGEVVRAVSLMDYACVDAGEENFSADSMRCSIGVSVSALGV